MIDDPFDITLQDGLRAAAKGKVPRTRRGTDKLNWKDWIGYILVIGMPVVGGGVANILWTWNQAGIARVERAHIMSTRETLIKDYNDKIENLEEAQHRQWRVFADFMHEMRSKP